jgi:hypothetical protein
LRRLKAVDDLHEAIKREQTPVSPGDLIAVGAGQVWLFKRMKLF